MSWLKRLLSTSIATILLAAGTTSACDSHFLTPTLATTILKECIALPHSPVHISTLHLPPGSPTAPAHLMSALPILLDHATAWEAIANTASHCVCPMSESARTGAMLQEEGAFGAKVFRVAVERTFGEQQDLAVVAELYEATLLANKNVDAVLGFAEASEWYVGALTAMLGELFRLGRAWVGMQKRGVGLGGEEMQVWIREYEAFVEMVMGFTAQGLVKAPFASEMVQVLRVVRNEGGTKDLKNWLEVFADPELVEILDGMLQSGEEAAQVKLRAYGQGLAERYGEETVERIVQAKKGARADGDGLAFATEARKIAQREGWGTMRCRSDGWGL